MSAAIVLVREFIGAWNALAFDRVMALLHPDVLYHNIPMQPIRGRAAVEQYLFGSRTFTDVDWEIVAIAAAGSTVLTERIDRFTVDGTRINLPIMGTFETAEGLITAWRDYFDLGMYRAQLAAH